MPRTQHAASFNRRPNNSDASRTVQISALNIQLDNAHQRSHRDLRPYAQATDGRRPDLCELCPIGAYCGDENVDIAAKIDDLDLALQTYIKADH